ncbi:MAG TPA: helix-turn-helix domain-containing protein [Desulfobacteraceae bacterium]|nr:helix-turn-helix domain-containing protein [Desulfobacteraceae bacterium]
MESKLTIREKLMLLEMAAFGKNVSAVCRYMGVSRKTYYQIKKAYEDCGVEGLAPKLHSSQNFKNRVSDDVEDAVLRLFRKNPGFGKKKISRTLKEQGTQISPNTVKAVLKRNDLGSIKYRKPRSA